MNHKKDITNRRFGRLLVIKESEKSRYWLCQCDCGKQKEIFYGSLTQGKSKSCGCLHREIAKKVNTRHGLTYHPLYSVWESMKTRCYNSNDTSYKYCGAKGIRVCKKWINDPEIFVSWGLKNGYKKGLEIDRIDNYKGYAPNNCRFITKLENQKNKRTIDAKSNTGIKYIYKSEGKYIVQKRVNNKLKYFGTFDNINKAKNKLKEINNESQD